LIIVIILAVATAILWFEPDIMSSLSALNPFGGRGETPPVTAGNMTAQSLQNRSDDPSLSSDSSSADDIREEVEEVEEELTPFEKEIRQRHESYQTKIYTYEPYEPLVMRNPFQRMVSSVYLEEEEEKLAGELATEEDVRRFVQPELPPNSRFAGLISAGDDKLAILEIDDDTYIVKEGDLILDKFLVKSIDDEKVIIEINGFEISLQLGGGEATNG